MKCIEPVFIKHLAKVLLQRPVNVPIEDALRIFFKPDLYNLC